MLPQAAIQRVQVRTTREDTPALRLSVTRQLGSADLRLPGTPPSAVLLVRRLRDPMPGRVSSHPSAVGIDPRWEYALRRRLETLRAEASRPRDGHIDSNAEAVLFADEAEMLACLALQIATTRSAHPWWRKALAHAMRTDAVHSLLGEKPELIPAVLSTLVRWRVEEQVTVTLADADARDLVDALARAMDLPLRLDSLPGPKPPSTEYPTVQSHPAVGSGAWPRADSEHPLPAPTGSQTRIAHDEQRAQSTEPRRAPWRDSWCPASVSALSPLQQLLVGFALTLQRAPTRARSPRFAREAVQWLLSGSNGAPGSRTSAEERDLHSTPPAACPPPTVPDWTMPHATDDAPPRSDGAPAVPRVEQSAVPSPGVATPTQRVRRPAGPGVRSDRTPRATPESQPQADHKTQAPEGSDRAPGAAPGAQTSRHRRTTTPPIMVEEIVPGPTPGEVDAIDRWGDEGSHTSLGGLLYLINIMEHFDLPECFETDCALASSVGAFGTLEGIARALLGPPSPELEQDALWTLLARLDQRTPGEPPRAAGLSVDALRLPPAWLVGDAEAPLPTRWAARNGRLFIWSRTGYPLVEVPLTGEGRRQAITELGRYPGNGRRGLLERGKASEFPRADLAWLGARGWPAPLVRWLELVTPFLRWRLARALGSSTASGLDLADELAYLPARLYVTDTHIDVVASIESIRMPLRMAGLDRSPGWVKRLSRVLLFHFE